MPPEGCDVQAREDIARLSGQFQATVERIDGRLEGIDDNVSKLQKSSEESAKSLAVIQAKFEADKWLLDKKIAALFIFLSPIVVLLCNLLFKLIENAYKHLLGLM